MTWRRLSAGAFAAAMFIACGEQARDAQPVAGPARRPQQTATTQPKSKDVTIDLVVTANPLIVLGHARTFENAVTVRALAPDKSVIAEQHVISTGEMGQSNPFRADLWMTRMPPPEITVEALSFSAKDGSVQASASRQAKTTMPSTSMALVFPTKDCTEFEVFRREVPKPAAIARLMVEALVAGPTADDKARGATPPFPNGSAVRSVVLRDGVLTVDFNERLQNIGGSCAATAVRESVTRTLRQLPTVRKVVITAGGSEKLALQP